MRASVKWLKDYVSFEQVPVELAEQLTMAGIPVATVEKLGEGIDQIVTGKITAIERHPDADKLSICQVDVGSEILTIVTGATNVKQGDVVPVALVGAILPNGLQIQPTKLRGILSSGMLCSTDELGMDPKIVPPENREGICILPPATPVGVDIKPVLGLDDTVLEFELTANRADCFSIIGLAREIAVLTGGNLQKPMLNVREQATENANNLVTIRIENQAMCPRFAARVLQDVKVGPSPEWLRHRLLAAGMRSINNVVDVTNFVMLEMGQPMHAYDYNLLSRHSIEVRQARPGERITTLDGVKRELNPEMIVIADAVQAVGIAGVMGGLATEVTNGTQNILLEAAAFNGVSIRRTSRALGLRSEASGRFERGVDTVNVVKALDRAAKLLQEMGACKVCPDIVDCYPGMVLPVPVTFVPSAVNAYLGTNVSTETMVDILRRLEFQVESEGETLIAVAPTWRADVTVQADIAEEIARIYGYHNIPSTIPGGQMQSGAQADLQVIMERVRDVLSGAGFDEVINFSFSHPSTLDKLNVPTDSKLRKAVPVLNPITDDFPLLRTHLLGGVLETILRNLSRKNDDIAIYELGAVYWPEVLPVTELPDEPMMLCGALTGRRNEISWNQSRDMVDFYDAKGAVELLLDALGIAGYVVSVGEHHAFHPGKTAIFVKDGQILATVGEIHPQVLRAFEINRKVYAFEMDMQGVVQQALATCRYQSLPKFPAIQRDLALTLALTVPAEEVIQTVKTSAGPLLSQVKLFDVYTGEQVPAGYRSMAFSLIFRSAEKTLTDAEVEAHYKNIVDCLANKFGAKLRA